MRRLNPAPASTQIGESVADRIYLAIRHGILSLALKPGEPLMEPQIALSMKVSRTPVREALRHLQRDGLVTIVPRKGAFVAPVPYEHFMELYKLRELLEGEAAASAALRIDEEELSDIGRSLEELLEMDPTTRDEQRMTVLDGRLHGLVLASSNYHLLPSIVTNLNDQLLRVRYLGMRAGPPERVDQILQELLRLVSALKSRSQSGAEEAMRAHVRAAREAVRQRI